MLIVFLTDCVLARGTFKATSSKQLLFRQPLSEEKTTALLLSSLWLVLVSTRKAEIFMVGFFLSLFCELQLAVVTVIVLL